MTQIADTIQQIKSSLPQGVTLIAVSKTHPIEYIEEAYAIGQRHFGENKVQELTSKAEALPKDILWHMIGHLQTNKVKYIVPFVHCIHSIDSFKLLEIVNKEARKCNRTINCLLQIHVAQEETKFGLTADELNDLLANNDIESLSNVSICGIMGMATNTDDEAQIRAEFHTIHEIFERTRARFFASDSAFREISMGMSGDYPIAIDEGATLIRIGSTIFGHRNYNK